MGAIDWLRAERGLAAAEPCAVDSVPERQGNGLGTWSWILAQWCH